MADTKAYARLEGRDFEYLMTKRRIAIGRDSKLGSVDINMGSTRFISRKHLEISLDGSRFHLLCRGKNGIFVDDVFQRREAKRMMLPFSCIIRFPSTSIKLGFTSLIEDNGYHGDAKPSSPLPPSSAFQSPYVTPLPSPTGTISVINSCPTSPGGGGMMHHPRIASIDFMAQYASKLLSQQKDRLASDSEPCDEAGSIGVNEAGEHSERLGSSGDSSPVATPTVLQSGGVGGDGDKTDEGETGGGGGGGENSNTVNESGNSTTDERVGKDGQKYSKPPYSYAQLIVQALLASADRKQTLSNIYQFISDKYPYYRLEDKGWKNSIRHNLSLNQYFMKAPREREGLGFGKGGYWCMHPDYEDKLTSQAYVKRKKKGIPVFPAASLMSRSAPPSPTHHHFAPDINLKEHHDSHFLIRPSPIPHPAHFPLPSFLPRLPQSASHSLPASPNRLPHFPSAGGPLRFYPLGINSAATSTEALALESRHRIRDEAGKGDLPLSKRPCLHGDDGVALKAPPTRHVGPVIMGGANHSLLGPHPIFPRFPYMGMPLLTPPPHIMTTPPCPPRVAPEQEREGREEEGKETKEIKEEGEKDEEDIEA